MKTYKNLYPQVAEWDNIMWAYDKARRGKRRTPAVAAFEFDQERYLVELHRELAGADLPPRPVPLLLYPRAEAAADLGRAFVYQVLSRLLAL